MVLVYDYDSKFIETSSIIISGMSSDSNFAYGYYYVVSSTIVGTCFGLRALGCLTLLSLESLAASAVITGVRYYTVSASVASRTTKVSAWVMDSATVAGLVEVLIFLRSFGFWHCGLVYFLAFNYFK